VLQYELGEAVSAMRGRKRSVPTSSQVLRVAWDVHQSKRNWTGTGVFAVHLLDHLRCQPGSELLPLAGWDVPTRRKGLPWRAARVVMDVIWTQAVLPFELAFLRPDVLHAPAFVAPLWGTCPLVVTIHDTIYCQFPEQHARWWVRYMNWLMPRVVARAAAIIAVSEATKQDVIRHFGADPSRIHVIYHGVDHGRFHPDAGTGAGPLLARYGIRGEYVLHVGALVMRKNIPLLLEAVALLKDRGHWGRRQVVLAGSASPGMPGAQAVYEAVDRLGLAEDVVCANHVPDAALPALYARAAVLAFPSRYEGFGLPLVEAMACGVPVVAAAGSAISEVVGTAGILISGDDREAFADGLLTVLENPEVRATLRERGLRRAANFTWDKAARQTIDVYREVVRAREEPGL